MLKEGDKAPDFTVLTDAGEEFHLANHKDEKIVLYFYPRADTPGCTIESCEFRDAVKKFTKKGLTVLRYFARHDESAIEVQREVRPEFYAASPMPIRKSPINMV